MVKHVGIFFVALGIVLLAAATSLEVSSENSVTGFAVGSLVGSSLSILDYSEALLFSLAVMSLIMGTMFLSKSRQ